MVEGLKGKKKKKSNFYCPFPRSAVLCRTLAGRGAAPALPSPRWAALKCPPPNKDFQVLPHPHGKGRLRYPQVKLAAQLHKAPMKL